MNALVAAQPIFDERLNVHAYDLEFRDGPSTFFSEAFKAASASEQRVDVCEIVNFDGVSGAARSHVVFPRDLLLRELPVLFPAEKLIVGLSADEAYSPELLTVCSEMKEFGYELALDGFALRHMDNPFVNAATIARVDIASVDEEDQKRICEELAGRGIHTLAKNVTITEALDRARQIGYTYCQGDFFRRPVPRRGKRVPPEQARHMQLLSQVNQPELAYDELEALIKRDVSMTYKLMRFINSAWYGLKQPVDSIRHALVLLGPAEVRLWATMLMLRDIGKEKPDELFRRSLMRAKMAERMARMVALKAKAPQLFLVGTFSLADALTDMPMAKLLSSLPLNNDIKEALLGATSRFGQVRKAVASYETGDWDSFSEAAKALDIDESAMPELFCHSRQWADEAMTVL